MAAEHPGVGAAQDSRLYEPVFWNKERQQTFKEFLHAEGPQPTPTDVAGRARMELFALQSTRDMLRQEHGYLLFEQADKLPEGAEVADIRIVAAYRSSAAFHREFVIASPVKDEPARSDRETAMFHVNARTLVVPKDDDPMLALDRAVDLTKSPTYRRHRRKLYEYLDHRMGFNGIVNLDGRGCVGGTAARVRRSFAPRFCCPL